MKPAKLAKLMKRHSALETECGMRMTLAYILYRDTPRKWISLTTFSGQNFVVEDK